MGERTRTQGGALCQGMPTSPGSGASASLERCCSYMASFSLWEHLLSFISVSWIYRITLVSARRETHLRGHMVRGSIGPTAIDPGQAILSQLRSMMSAVIKVLRGQPGRWHSPPWPPPSKCGQVTLTQGQTGRRGEEEGCPPLFL